jgi:hypothetical protein
MMLVMINLDHVLGINLCQMWWEACSLTFIMLHVRTESYGNLRTARPPMKTARLNLGYEIFRA